MRRNARTAVVLAMLLATVTAALAQGEDDAGTAPATYVLVEGSQYQHGCFDPCLCPVWISEALVGKLKLAPAESNPLFQYYDVTEVAWAVELYDGTTIPITGSGTYQIGGEVALQHRLALDLVVGDDPVEHFDSGLVVGGSEFPAIDIQISIHGGYCFDTVIDVVAKPVPMLAPTDASLVWSPVPTAFDYDVVVGDLGVLVATHGDFAAATTACFADGVSGTSVPFEDDPPSGEGRWFLVRGSTGAGVGSYDCAFPSQIAPRDAGIAAGPDCP